jgi:hypothetical protein
VRSTRMQSGCTRFEREKMRPADFRASTPRELPPMNSPATCRTTGSTALRFAASGIGNRLGPHFSGCRATTAGATGARKHVEFRRAPNRGVRPYRGRLGEAKRIPIRAAGEAAINPEPALLEHAFRLDWPLHAVLANLRPQEPAGFRPLRHGLGTGPSRDGPRTCVQSRERPAGGHTLGTPLGTLNTPAKRERAGGTSKLLN